MFLVVDIQIVHLLYEIVYYLPLCLDSNPFLFVHLIKRHDKSLEDGNVVPVFVRSN